MKTFLATGSAVLYALAAIPANACGGLAVVEGGCPPGPGGINAVPEISALEGTAAIAAILAIVVLAWERRRRLG